MNLRITDNDEIAGLLVSSARTKLGHDAPDETNGREAWEGRHGGEFPSHRIGANDLILLEMAATQIGREEGRGSA